MSPVSQWFVSRLSYVILDEVHCISWDDSGHVWVNILRLLPCPFLALSATIGHAHDFASWLNLSWQNKVERKVKIVSLPPDESSDSSSSHGKKGHQHNHKGKHRGKKRSNKRGGGGGGGAAAGAAAAAASNGKHSDVEEHKREDEDHDGSDIEDDQDEVHFVEYKHKWAVTKVWEWDDQNARLQRLHPMAVFDAKTVALPRLQHATRHLTGDDALVLWRIMSHHAKDAPAQVRDMLAEAQPSKIRSPTAPMLSNIVLHEYAQLVGNTFVKWCELAPTSANAVIASLNDTLRKGAETAAHTAAILAQINQVANADDAAKKKALRRHRRRLAAKKDGGDESKGDVNDDDDDEDANEDDDVVEDFFRHINDRESVWGKSVVRLLLDLHMNGKLPAIVFCWSRQRCEDLANLMREFLQFREERAKADEIFGLYMDERVKWKEAGVKALPFDAFRSRMMNDDSDSSNNKAGDKHIRELEKQVKQGDASQAELEAVRDQYRRKENKYQKLWHKEGSLVSEGAAMAQADFRDLSWGLEADGPVVQGALRGVGVHHGQCGFKHRRFVETMFRQGQIRVVFATSTLALGVSMPAQTTVFFQDSPWFGPLEYEQMKGRAGRRGFDRLGHAIFCQVPRLRIQHLLGSGLATVPVQFAVSPSYVLRAVSVHASKKDKEIKDANPERLIGMLQAGWLDTPQFVSHPDTVDKKEQQEREWLQSRAQCLSGLSVLQACNLVDNRGEPTGLAPLAAHVSSSEPANLMLAFMLSSPIVGELCQGAGDSEQRRREAAEDLLTVLCHMFYVVPLDAKSFEARKKSGQLRWSQCRLQPLEDRQMWMRVCRLWREFDDRVLAAYRRNFTALVRSNTSLQHAGNDMLRLPVSQIDFERAQSIASPGKCSSSLRCPFVSLTGCGDRSESLLEMISTLRMDVPMDPACVPYAELGHLRTQALAAQKGDDSDGVWINSYALDFYKHGVGEAVVRDNLLHEKDAWYAIERWSSLLTTVAITVRKINEDLAAHPMSRRDMARRMRDVGATTAHLVRGFHAKFRAFNQIDYDSVDKE